ncbi:hypothetical protein OESDEN_16768 [Oesophagostomum dentatum]|uniref:PSI domain-containing protein n=1 Tax=Oesophagostomum dentatum TaxID=61180 RepID=A0A0B1SDZ2_OESDE|nr:hypothetical protein OESDEN_16768 [Oesophagostomum dentatum]
MCKQQQTCTDCLSMGDPDCAWVLHGAECVPVSENIYRREYLTQEIGKCSHQVSVKTTTTEEPPQQRKMQCLCETPTQSPCTTEVFQREVVTSSAEIRNEPLDIVSVLHWSCNRRAAELATNEV